jgi:superkiller protein 3
LEFSKRAFENLGRANPNNLEEVLPIFHALDRYCKWRPTDASALHLFALVCERVDQVDKALVLVSECISLLERAYEETEDPKTEEHFAFANGTLGRLLLAVGDFEKAIAAFGTSLSLLSSDSEDIRVRTIRTLAQFGSGIAHFKQEELEEALGFFETCLSEVSDDMGVIRGHVTILLSQTLWALGSPEAQETARGQLLEW